MLKKIFIINFMVLVLTGCMSPLQVLEADARCNSALTKEEYRDCLAQQYQKSQQEMQQLQQIIINEITK